MSNDSERNRHRDLAFTSVYKNAPYFRQAPGYFIHKGPPTLAVASPGYTTVNRHGYQEQVSRGGCRVPLPSQVGAMSRSSGPFTMLGGGEAKVRFPTCFFSCNAIGLMLNFAKVEGRLPLLTRPLFSGLWQCQSLVRCLSGTYPV